MTHLPIANAADIGLDPQRLAAAYSLMEEWTQGDHPPIPGGGILVGRHGKTVERRLFGRMQPSPEGPPIRDDAIFLLASLTKPITYLAAMMLVERGMLSLSQKVIRYIPEFAAHHKEETLVQHLFTHTSGMPDMLDNHVELRRQHAPLSRFIQGAILETVPLFPPGTNHKYQSMGTLIVAEIIQRLSGKPIREFLRDEIFIPLGLRDTSLGCQGLDSRRLVHVRLPEYLDPTFGWNSKYWQELGAPWGGMFSTLSDFGVICQWMLERGKYGATRLLSQATVSMMTMNRLDDHPDVPEGVRRSRPWGLGWQMNHPGTSSSLCDLLGRHVFGHTGSTGTLVWIDPATEVFCLIFTSGGVDVDPWRLNLSNAVAAAVV